MRNILEIRDLQVHYGGIEAVRGISLDVPEGEIVTLIGANGAGKSSTLRAIAGLVKPSAGKISFLDEDITGMDSSMIVSKGITLVPEGRRIFPDMTVLENLKIGAYLRRHAVRRRAADAGGWPCAHEPPQGHHDGRAVSGTCAHHRQGHF